MLHIFIIPLQSVNHAMIPFNVHISRRGDCFLSVCIPHVIFPAGYEVAPMCVKSRTRCSFALWAFLSTEASVK